MKNKNLALLQIIILRNMRLDRDNVKLSKQ